MGHVALVSFSKQSIGGGAMQTSKFSKSKSQSKRLKMILLSSISLVAIVAGSWISANGYSSYREVTDTCSQGSLYRFKIQSLMGHAISNNSYSSLLSQRPLSYVDGESDLSFISARGSLNSDMNLIKRKSGENPVTGLLLSGLTQKLDSLSQKYKTMAEILASLEMKPETRTYLDYDSRALEKINMGLSLMNYALALGRVTENPFQDEIDALVKKRDAAYNKLFTAEVKEILQDNLNAIVRASKPIEEICKRT